MPSNKDKKINHFRQPTYCKCNVVCQGGQKKVMNKQEMQDLAKKIMSLNHVGIQCDDIHYCEEMHQTLRLIDRMERHDAVRLLMHVIQVQQLQLVGANIEYEENNPFKDMVNFDYIDSDVKCYSPEMETLY